MHGMGLSLLVDKPTKKFLAMQSKDKSLSTVNKEDDPKQNLWNKYESLANNE